MSIITSSTTSSKPKLVESPPNQNFRHIIKDHLDVIRISRLRFVREDFFARIFIQSQELFTNVVRCRAKGLFAVVVGEGNGDVDLKV